jgi:hypothetical protein
VFEAFSGKTKHCPTRPDNVRLGVFVFSLHPHALLYSMVFLYSRNIKTL